MEKGLDSLANMNSMTSYRDQRVWDGPERLVVPVAKLRKG